MEYTCTKCGAVCDVEADDDHPGHANCWCDECNDYPGGWLTFKGDSCPAADYGADMLSSAIDRAHDEYKDRKLFGG